MCPAAGEWCVPTVVGSWPTACAGCSLTKVDFFRAVLFGGFGVGDICVPGYLRILTMKRNPVEKWVCGKHTSAVLAGIANIILAGIASNISRATVEIANNISRAGPYSEFSEGEFYFCNHRGMSS